MNFLPGSIIFVFSPLLCYGLEELLLKAGPECFVFLIEYDKVLNDFSKDFFDKYAKEHDLFGKYSNFEFLEGKKSETLAYDIDNRKISRKYGKDIPFFAKYKRIVTLDFSGGAALSREFYDKTTRICNQKLHLFWSNTLTLTKFGRKYSHNFFSNLLLLEKSKPLSKLKASITKPLVVFGAGESSEQGILDISAKRDSYFILCVDTAFPMLLSHGLTPDGIVLEEAQSVISQSFIGARNAGCLIFQSLSSIPHPAGIDFPLTQTVFYATEYADNTEFFNQLKEEIFFPETIMPLGSVGNTAFYLANILKKDDTVPVVCYGLDFMYSAGKTHAKGTPAYNRQQINSNRLRGLENFGASWTYPAEKLDNGNYSTPILKSYRVTFEELNAHPYWKNTRQKPEQDFSNSDVSEYLSSEKRELELLKEILSGQTELSEDDAMKEIFRIAEPREYLYLHFPDGKYFSNDLSFLKRVRSEIDSYLKILSKV